MLYSWEALREVDSMKGELGRSITRGALDVARKDGRDLVTEDDVRASVAMICVGGLTPMDDYFDEEGDFDPEYARPSEAEGWRRFCTGILAFAAGCAFAFAMVKLAIHIGGPLE